MRLLILDVMVVIVMAVSPFSVRGLFPSVVITVYQGDLCNFFANL